MRDTPYLAVDVDLLDRNLTTMADSARARGLALRPHAKTHKCVEIARRQVALSRGGLTPATVGEAEVFTGAGFDDLFLASPLVATGPRAARLRALAEQVRLRVGVDSAEGPHARQGRPRGRGARFQPGSGAGRGRCGQQGPRRGPAGVDHRSRPAPRLTAGAWRRCPSTTRAVTFPDGAPVPDVGEAIGVAPNHVCTTVSLADELVVMSGGVEVERWAVAARGRNT